MGSSNRCCVSARHLWGQRGCGRGGPPVGHQGLSTLKGQSEVSGLRVYRQAPVGGSGSPAGTMTRPKLGCRWRGQQWPGVGVGGGVDSSRSAGMHWKEVRSKTRSWPARFPIISNPSLFT